MNADQLCEHGIEKWYNCSVCDAEATEAARDAQLAALRDERDRAVRVLKVVASGAEKNTENYGLDLRGWNVTAYDFEDVPGDFDYLRQLIESEEGQ